MNLLKAHPWTNFSRKLIAKIEHPQFRGTFNLEDARSRSLRLVVGREANMIALYWLVDETDGVIADIKYQAFGPAALIGAIEGVCELLIHKNYDQAQRISAQLLENHLGGFAEGRLLNCILAAITDAAEQCSDIELPGSYVAPPMSWETGVAEEYPGWKELSKEQKIVVIEEIIAREIRPYIELDEGGVQIKDLEGDKVTIAYQGSCTTCYSATGATLSAIQQILRSKVFGSLEVVPDLSSLMIENQMHDDIIRD
ncbi:MAG: NifU family protein [Verrucomicrobia bacterium]|nr:NifU family protein [Verrucomicrobiota bacterium]